MLDDCWIIQQSWDFHLKAPSPSIGIADSQPQKMNPFFGFGFGFASSWSEISRNLSCNGFRIRIPDSGFASSCYRKSTMDSQDMDSGFGFPVLKLDSGFGFAKWIRIRQMDSDSLTRRTATRTKTVIQ